jgi:hypothetical protein
MIIFRLHAIAGWTLALPAAEVSLTKLAEGEAFEPAYWALVIATFTALSGALAMPALVYATRALLGLAWVLIKLVAQAVLHEIVKWILVAGGASLGILHYLEWLPAFH